MSTTASIRIPATAMAGAVSRDPAVGGDRPGDSVSPGASASPGAGVSPGDSVTSGQRVLRLEAEGLSQLAASLDDRFRQAVELLAGASGRAIVTGMGKSGHVARKIAATLASTGTPAYFVHPAEASHGDLGMVTAGDAVLALSNSGETPELADIVDYTRRFGIPLIAITGRADSVLGETADVLLLLPALAEACPLGLAPTTTTTAMLALGDALAVALLERKGFSSSDFRQRHPGGSLGRRLQRVSELMHAGAAMPLVRLDTPMADTVLEITAKSLGCVGVTDAEGRLAGVITDGDLRRHMDSALLARLAGQIMTSGPKTIRADALAAEALHIMNNTKITSLFAVEDGRPVGLLHIHDCLRAGIV